MKSLDVCSYRCFRLGQYLGGCEGIRRHLMDCCQSRAAGAACMNKRLRISFRDNEGCTLLIAFESKMWYD